MSVSAANLLAIFGAIAACLAVGSAVVIGLRGKALTADLDRLRHSNEDLDAELQRKDRRLHDAEVEIEHLKTADAAKSAALARIGEAAASGAEMQELAAALREASGLARDHDREAASRHAGVIRELRGTRDALTAMKTALDERKDEQ